MKYMKIFLKIKIKFLLKISFYEITHA